MQSADTTYLKLHTSCIDLTYGCTSYYKSATFDYQIKYAYKHVL